MRTVAFLVDWPDRYRFFRRMVPALTKLGFRAVFLSNKVSLIARARSNGIDAELIVRSGPREGADLARCREVACGMLSDRQAQVLYWSTRAAVERVHDQGRISSVVVWNGGGVAARAVADFSRSSGLGSAFLEIANLPGKIVVDPAGVNASASIADDPSLLDGFAVDLEGFEAWRADYVATRIGGRRTLPQADLLMRPDLRSSFVNNLAFRFRSVPRDDRTSLVAKGVRMMGRRFQPALSNGEWQRGSYVLFPMQVSNDTQVTLNSDVGVFEAIERAEEVAGAAGLSLVVKPHPAEPDPAVRARLKRKQRSNGFFTTGGDSFFLAQNAARVVTINSTVGLEALLAGTPVDFLGRTPFRHLSSAARLMQYIQSYLLDVEYFSEEAIPRRDVAVILDRSFGSWKDACAETLA